MAERWAPKVDVRAEKYYTDERLKARFDDRLSDARVLIDEWRYDGDEHDYCHLRTLWVALVMEIDRLRDVAP